MLLETGGALSASTLRRLACDADLIAMVLGSRSQILDVGRSQRLVTPALWLALVVRDRHCAFPGCSRPPVACDAHHIVHWADGGITALGNLVLLCRAHHTTPWQVTLDPEDHRPLFWPPPRPDPRPDPDDDTDGDPDGDPGHHPGWDREPAPPRRRPLRRRPLRE